MITWNSSLYPTREHEDAALYATSFFSSQKCVDAVLLTCSCARGKAVPGSCVDISVLLRPHTDRATRERLACSWGKHSEGSPVLTALAAHGKYAEVHLDMTDGVFREGYHGWCSGPDDFEVEIGNLLEYSVALCEKGTRLSELREVWLPYYTSELRNRRLAMVGKYCLNNIDHVGPYVERRLYFQALRRLYNATGEFLQALFMAKRKYPVAYDKWIREQIVEILGLPEIYPRLVDLLSIKDFESTEMKEKADTLHDMFNEYCVVR